MNINHKQKSFDKLLKKSAKAVLTVIIAVMAVVAGIQAGNLWYKLDLHIIKNIDPNNFKNLISISIPIVESVYNSGKSSVSFSGEVKELFVKVFDFDLDSPASILNAQSPIFKSYFNVMSMKKLAMGDNGLSGDSTAPGAGNNGSQPADGNDGVGSRGGGTGSGSGSGGGTGSGGTGSGGSGGGTGSGGSGGGSGDSSDGSGSGGTNIGNGAAAGSSDGGTGSGNGDGNGTGDGNGAGIGAGNGGAVGNGTNKNQSGDNLFVGQLDSTPESSMSIGTEYGFDINLAITGQTNNGTGQNNNGTGGANGGSGGTGVANGGTGGANQGSQGSQGSQGNLQQSGSQSSNNQLAQGVQPISSVAFEIEDEKEGEEKETVELNKIQIKNYTTHKIDIAKLLKEPLNINLSKKGPKVLIYHTHTTESYVLKEADLGKKDVSSFNSNPKYNVVRVGEELTRNLEKYGIDTLHNGTVHDKVHDAAYGASINTIQSYKKSYPSIQVYIDIHRDAVDSEKPKLRMTKEINGKNCAQIMFVVGADGVLPHPEWKENLKFVLKLQQKLNEKYPGLAKPVRIVAKRYNQQISNNAILIEVGGDGNLLSECIESTKYLAEVLNDVMKSK